MKINPNYSISFSRASYTSPESPYEKLTHSEIVKSNGGQSPTATKLYGLPSDGFDSDYESHRAANRLNTKQKNK